MFCLLSFPFLFTFDIPPYKGEGYRIQKIVVFSWDSDLHKVELSAESVTTSFSKT